MQGDQGNTSLIGGIRVSKDDLRIAIGGGLDELSASLGVARAFLKQHKTRTTQKFVEQIQRVQQELLDFGVDVVSPASAKLKIGIEQIAEMEVDIQSITEKSPLPKQFVLPGENRQSALIHVARAVCRRVEREFVAFLQNNARPGNGRWTHHLVYLNRLSFFLFVLACETSGEPPT
ncbi:MAG: cob(I)yrinic acid a,c-diamide adenosyltransferase [Thermoguttaceae bacterium]